MTTKTTYIAHDDTEFETEAKCLAWEDALEFEDVARRQGVRSGVCHIAYSEFLASTLATHYLKSK